VRPSSVSPIQPFRLLLVILVAASATLLGACGRDDAVVDPDGGLQGMPLWRSSREGVLAGSTGFTLQARSPARARLRAEATGSLSRALPWRDLASGQTVLVTWSHEQLPAELVTDVPAPEDAAAGRTEGQGALVTFGFGDRGLGRERYVFFVRPGRGRLLTRDALPPGRYEPLARGATIELATLVLTDLARGEAQLRSEELSSRIVPPEAMTTEDRIHEVHVFLDIELPGDGAAAPAK